MPKSPKSAAFDESLFWRREINGEIVEVPESLRAELRRSEQELERFLTDTKAGKKPALGPEQVQRCFDVAAALAECRRLTEDKQGRVDQGHRDEDPESATKHDFNVPRIPKPGDLDH